VAQYKDLPDESRIKTTVNNSAAESHIFTETHTVLSLWSIFRFEYSHITMHNVTDLQKQFVKSDV